MANLSLMPPAWLKIKLRHVKLVKKKFPRPSTPITLVNESAYPHYAGPHNDRTYPQRTRRGGGFDATNQWVVSYNGYLSERYNAHINVELCQSIDAIRYLFKYVFKGGDCSVFEVQTNEIHDYRDGRYISPVQAAYDLNEYDFHGLKPAVHLLAFHLQGVQPVYFGNDANHQEIEAAMEQAKSKLLAFFKYISHNKSRDDFRALLYVEFPTQFVWDTREKQ